MDNTSFRGGFIRAMKDVVDDTRRSPHAMLEHNTRSYVEGYVVGRDHFNGFCTHGVDLANRLGLIDEYAEFYGQSDFNHPNP